MGNNKTALFRRHLFSPLVPIGIFAILPLIQGCAQFKPPTESSAKKTSSSSHCEIDNGEDRDDQILKKKGRGGYFYTYLDKEGSTISPASGDVKMERGGQNSNYAIHFHGKIAQGEDVFAGLGFTFTEPKRAYDASYYRGIVFYAKRGKNSTSALRLKIPDGNTDPDGKVCKDCYNDFGIDFQLQDKWTRYEVAFADLKQETDWGTPRPPHIQTNKLFGIQWQVTHAGSNYDVWIDNIAFLGCNK